MKKQVSLLLCLFGCYFLRPQLTSKPRSYSYPCSERKIYNEIRQHKAAVVLFYDEPNCARRDTNQTLKELKGSFARLAKSGFYPRKAVRFVHANIAKSAGRTIAEDNHIALDKLPAVVLFSDGMPIEDQHGVVAYTGGSSRNQLKQFIDNYLSLDIAQYVQEERAFKQYQEIIRDRAHVYYTPYFSRIANPWNDWWGWPYYGQAQGNYGGNVGVNFFGSNY